MLKWIYYSLIISNVTGWSGDDSGVEPLDYIPNSQVKRMSRQWYLVVMASESRLSPALPVTLQIIKNFNPWELQKSSQGFFFALVTIAVLNPFDYI